MDSILNSIKKMLGIAEDDTSFDTDIIFHINSVLMTLGQLGVGTLNFVITGSDEMWEQLLGAATNLEAVKSYIYMKVKLAFDPPAHSFVIDAVTRQVQELEWRLAVQADPPLPTPVPEEE